MNNTEAVNADYYLIAVALCQPINLEVCICERISNHIIIYQQLDK